MGPYIKVVPSQDVQCLKPHYLHICGVLLIITFHRAKWWEWEGSPGLQRQLAFLILYLFSPNPWGLAPFYLSNDFPILASSAKGVQPSGVFDGIFVHQSQKESLYLCYKETGRSPQHPGHFVCILLSHGLKQMQICIGVDFSRKRNPNPWVLWNGHSQNQILRSTPLHPMFPQHSCWSEWTFGFHTLYPSLSINLLIYNKLWFLSRKEKETLPLIKLWECEEVCHALSGSGSTFSSENVFPPFGSAWALQNLLSLVLQMLIASSCQEFGKYIRNAL